MAECICRLCHHHRVEGERLRSQVAALTAERDEARQHAESAEANVLAERLAMVAIRAQRDAATQRAEAAEARASKAESILHDAVATPLAEWATTLAAANENVAGVAALLAEEKKAREAAEAKAGRMREVLKQIKDEWDDGWWGGEDLLKRIDAELEKP